MVRYGYGCSVVLKPPMLLPGAEASRNSRRRCCPVQKQAATAAAAAARCKSKPQQPPPLLPGAKAATAAVMQLAAEEKVAKAPAIQARRPSCYITHSHLLLTSCKNSTFPLLLMCTTCGSKYCVRYTCVSPEAFPLSYLFVDRKWQTTCAPTCATMINWLDHNAAQQSLSGTERGRDAGFGPE